MFGEPIPEANEQHDNNEDSLAKLIVRKIDVAVIVAGQSAKLFQNCCRSSCCASTRTRPKPRAPSRPISPPPATIRTTSYPNWIQEDKPTLTVKANLRLRAAWHRGRTVEVRGFAVHELRPVAGEVSGHPKWKQVHMELPPLTKGWKSPPMEKRLRACIAHREALAKQSQGGAQQVSTRSVDAECTEAQEANVHIAGESAAVVRSVMRLKQLKRRHDRGEPRQAAFDGVRRRAAVAEQARLASSHC